jgi:hypothetical protein
MITDTIQHSKIKSLMKNIATEDAVQELRSVGRRRLSGRNSQKTAELADLDVAGAVRSAVSQKERIRKR